MRAQTAFGGFSAVTELLLDHNQLTALPDLSDLDKLEVLDASDNIIHSIELESATITNLRLWNNPLQDVGGVAALGTLTELQLGATQASPLGTASKVAQIAQLDNVQSLWLQHPNGAASDFLGGLAGLEWLILEGGIHLSAMSIGSATHLKLLEVSGGDLPNIAFAPSLSEFSWFTLRDTAVSNITPLVQNDAFKMPGRTFEFSGNAFCNGAAKALTVQNLTALTDRGVTLLGSCD